LGVDLEEVVLIGDGARDMECASKLKVMTVGLPAGTSSKEELTASGANYLVTSVADEPRLDEDINRLEKQDRDRQ
jgi:phosphoglycolate phosphatase-like HAD superfamily hydrolase